MTAAERLEVDRLKRQVKSLRIEIRELQERVDTVFSWPWKRVWWLLQGYKWYKVGRWYGN